MAKILVTGSNGFIGRRLIFRLLEDGHDVYALVRSKKGGTSNPRLHTILGDFSIPEKMETLPKDIDAAYYLIHSMAKSVENLIETEKDIAQNFISAIEETNCTQIIYLSGIIEDETELSTHLKSRLTVEKLLCSSHIPCTVLRSSIIIGEGSASFEIIRDLSEKLPIMIAPKWVKSSCQPIAVIDVLFYLSHVLLNPSAYGAIFDIGGPETMTFKEILLRYAAFRKLKRLIIDVPVLTPRLSSYWLVFITSVPLSICSYLVDSMRQNSRKINKTIDEILPHACLSYDQSLKVAIQKIAQNEAVTFFPEPWEPNMGAADEFVEVPKAGCLLDSQIIPITVPIEEVRRRIWSIGGKQGWYSMNWAWKLRGWIDQMVGGAGFDKGRRDATKIEVGDCIDFWRVLHANEDKHHLILYAKMKLPGDAWLEFKIDEKKKVLKQTATFRPRGVLGRFYWYMLWPIHKAIFTNMAKAIAQKPL